MRKQAFAAITLCLGLSLTLGSTSCVTCPDGQQSCGSSDSSGDAGASGAEDVECDLLTQMRNCMDAFCKTTTNPFCTCYKRGFDLSTNGCKCVDFDAKTFCDRAQQNGSDATSYDCAAASSGVSSYCVDVQ